jgi:hypothetical protein
MLDAVQHSRKFKLYTPGTAIQLCRQRGYTGAGVEVMLEAVPETLR